MRGPAVAAISVALAGCALRPAPVPPEPGPTLVLQAANASDRDVEALVEFGAHGASGQAGGTLPACQRVTIGFGSVSGDYRVLVEGEPAGAGVVPAGLGPEEAFVIRINVAPNGDVQVPPPIAMPEEPSGGAAIPGCGEE